MSTYNCHKFGTNYVLVGLKVTYTSESLLGIDLFCAPLRADGTLGSRIFLPGTARDGKDMQAVCPNGQAVVGAQVTDSDTGPLTSIQIHCSVITSTGLATGAAPTKIFPPLGIPIGKVWGPSICTQGRPAKAVRTHISLAFVAGVNRDVRNLQLLCEQPTRGN